MIFTAEQWNDSYVIQSNYETCAQAKATDIVTTIGGIAFLLQTTDGYNNVIASRVGESDCTVLQSFKGYRQFLQAHGIRYIRIEGNPRRYFFLQKAFPGKVVQDHDEIPGRNVFYADLF